MESFGRGLETKQIESHFSPFDVLVSILIELEKNIGHWALGTFLLGT